MCWSSDVLERGSNLLVAFNLALKSSSDGSFFILFAPINKEF